ncbi:MAG TPA: alkaline phosphatase family protein, partial [Candidatus Binatia bacterium]|nr:alkaline phosphatase family protein [Candidatus Binatia bacterium]
MNRISRLLRFAAGLLVCGVMAPGSQSAPAITHVVQISLDGLGATYLQSYLQTAPAQFPTFVRLTREAAFTMNARCDYDISETIPNHVTMFTGRPVFQPAGESNTVHHGYNNNAPTAAETLHNSGNTNVPYKASMFDVAHDYGRTTAFYAGKGRLAICDRSYNETNGAPDSVAVGGDNGRDKIDFASVLDISGAAISNEVNLLLADLTNATPKHYSFIHVAEPDVTGHAANWGSANWSNAVRMVDAQLARIIDAID